MSENSAFPFQSTLGLKWHLTVLLICIYLTTVSVFSCAHWPFVYLLWSPVYSKDEMIFLFQLCVANLKCIGVQVYIMSSAEPSWPVGAGVLISCMQ